MATKEGFTIEISSRYEGWWRYNVALMCGCFDTAGNRIDRGTCRRRRLEPAGKARRESRRRPRKSRNRAVRPPSALHLYRTPYAAGRQRHRRHGTLRSRNPHRIRRTAAPRGETPHQPVVGRLDRDARGFRSPVAGIPGQHPPSRNTLPGRATSAPPQPQKKKEPTRVPSSIIATAYDYLLL